ncbi:MAG: hypothetical protein WCP06_09205 [Verrucomicrobiota bacterium]
MKFRISNFFFSSLTWATLAVTIQAQPSANPYEVLSRTLMPIAGVFAPQSAQHALSATLVLERMTDLPPEFAGTRVELALQPPEHLLIRGQFQGEPAAVCRVDQEIWLTPGSKLQALINPEPVKKKKKKHGEGLAPLVLPFPPQQLVLLPMLFQVKDAGEESGLRVLDVQLMPELARNLGIEQWHARISVDAEAKPVRIEVARPDWSIVLKVEQLAYAPELPAATWTAPAGGDVLRLTGAQARQWLDAVIRKLN